MSSGDRRDLSLATADAEAFRRLFAGTYERWEVAGSVRRRVSAVGDIEHVVVGRGVWDRMAELMPEPGLFEARQPVLTRAVYPDGKHRWGDRYRGVVFRGFRHDVFRSEPETLGAILAIRTGPADFSREMVMRLRERGLCMNGGRVETSAGNPVPCASEPAFFVLLGAPWMEPHLRGTNKLGRYA